MILDFDGDPVRAEKARPEDFTPHHDDQLRQVTYADLRLRFPDPRWRSRYLGSGEEKASFCVCDQDGRVFLLEIIDERTYLDGRFVGGTYFFERRVPGLTGVPLRPQAIVGLRFTGLVKIREFVYGYEWGRFQWRPERHSWLDRPLTGLLRMFLGGRYDEYRRRYRDVHERNVLFEVRPFRDRGVPMLACDRTGRPRLVRVGLQPVDVR